MSDDFIYDEQEPSAAGGRSPFFVAAGILGTIFVLAAICSAVFWFIGNGEPDPAVEAEIAARETQNAVVAVTNAAVTATIAAMETEAARPTETPTTPPTFTPQPTNSPTPSPTPVVQSAEDGSPTPNLLATEIAEEGGAGAGDGSGGTPTPIPGFASGGSGSDSGALPETGIDTGSALLAAVVLIVVLAGARRLRS